MTMAATLDDFLSAYDGGLAIVREYEGSWHLVLQDGRACILPTAEVAEDLLSKCGRLSYGIVALVEGEWRLTKPPVLSEQQVRAVERVLGTDGDEMLARLREQAENGA